jgi:hypothetical protein
MTTACSLRAWHSWPTPAARWVTSPSWLPTAARRAVEAEKLQALLLALDEVLAVLVGSPLPPRAEPPET